MVKQPTILTRKAQRKQERQQKKQNRAQHYNKHNQKAAVQKGRVPPKAPAIPAVKRQKTLPPQPEDDDDEEILSDELNSCQDSSEIESDTASETEEAPEGPSKKGYNRYGTKDPIIAAAEEALDNGLFDSEGNLDSEGFEGLFGAKFEESHSEPEEESVASHETESDNSSDESEVSVDLMEKKKTEVQIKPTVEKAKPENLPVTEQRLQLIKKVKGLLNRLSQSNFESIAVSIEEIYKEHPRRDVTEVITDLILAAITTQGNLLDSFVLVFASLVATLSHLIGVEFAAFLLQKMIEVFTENNTKASDSASVTSDGGITPERVVINVVTFLSFLYDLQIVSNQIVGDLIVEAVSRLNELDTEIILKLIRNCGAQFRRDDPSTLKEIIINLNERVMSIPKETQSSRFKFMLESIYDLKNNKQKSASIQLGDLETSKKLLRNMAQQRSISKFEPLRIGLDDLRNADTRGRWWLVGGTWAPNANEAKVSNSSVSKVKDEVTALAKEQRMNTDVRKAIFSALISSDDYVDAFQRLLNLKLTSKQERDIAVVILHCCVQEKVYNPFYALVAQKFVSFKHNFLITFKYSFWDWLQQIEESSLRKISHLANFYGFLLTNQCLPLAMVKKMDFLHLGDKEAVFFQMLFSKTLTETSEETLSSIFEQFSTIKKATKKVTGRDVFGSRFGDEQPEEEDEEEVRSSKAGEDLQPIKAAIKIFFTFYLKEKSKKELPFVKDHGLLLKRLDFVAVYLN